MLNEKYEKNVIIEKLYKIRSAHVHLYIINQT